MQEHIKKHDLRDDIYQPKTSVTPLHKDDLYEVAEANKAESTGTLATPDKGVVEGQTTHM